MMLHVAACALMVGVGAFNLDVKHSMVFKDPEGQLGSYFGFTVSLLKESGLNGGSWLLAGAPRGNSSYPKQNSINQPGVVYQCKLGENNDACKSLVLEAEGNKRVSVPNGYSYIDKKDHAWIGGALEVQSAGNGRIVVCGQCWKNLLYSDHYPMNGVCYWLNGAKDFDKDAGKLIPLLKKSHQGYKLKESYGLDRDPNKLFYYLYGGAGMSVNFIANSTEMIIGAPGVFEWMGTIIRYRDAVSRSSFRPYSNAFIPNPYRTEKFTPDSYFGYSVGSGRFFRSNQIFYVGGAPRAGNLKGMVLIFDFPDSEEESLIIKIELEGFQMGEYFGSSICVVDLNFDGLDDLVVGAPQHSLQTSSVIQKAGDEGRIYVFINDGNGRMNEIGDKTKIMGSQQHGARFGTSISNVGDLNNDGFSDIAVGAPYENFGHGAVYIYHGHSNGINPKFVQRITALEIDHSILGFGISISKGSDIDENHYIDMAVGAYESGHAVLLKSHTIITFHTHLATNVHRINFDATGFLAKACIYYTGKYVPTSLVAAITVKADSTHGRAQFVLDSGTTGSHSYKLNLSHEVEQCEEFKVQILATFQDFSKPIEITMEYKLVDSADSPSNHKDRKKRDISRDFCKLCPVVDPSVPSHITHKVPYVTGCGADDICRTDIKTEELLMDDKVPFVIGTASTMKMKVVVRNAGDPAFLSQTNITLPSITPLMRIPKNCRELPFSINSPVHKGLLCEMGNPLPSNETRELLLEFDTKNIPPGSERLAFQISSGSAGEELQEKDNIKEIIIPLKTISDLSISGKSSQDQFYLPKKNDSYSEKILSFSHVYEVRNFGPSPVNQVNLTFNIPIKIETSSGSIHFVKVYEPQANLDSQPFPCSAKGFKFYSEKNRGQRISMFSDSELSSDSFSDEEKINLDENESRRRKRNTGDIRHSSIPSLSFLLENRTFFVNCSVPGTECMTVECIAGPFKSAQMRAIIIFPLIVTPKVLEPVLESKDIILLSSSGNAIVLDHPPPFQPDDHKPDFADVYTMFLGKLPESKIAAWILALAIIGGLLILLLLILGLIKMGFFKRDKKEELKNLMHRTEMEDKLINDVGH